MKSKYWVLMGGGLVLCALIFVIIYTQANKSPITNESQNALQLASQSADFHIYTPNDLPKNYILKESTVSFSQNVLTYTVLTNNNQSIVITQQTKPEQIDINSFTGLRFETPLGKASTNTFEGTISTALVTKDNVLILITAHESVGLDNIKATINSFQKL